MKTLSFAALAALAALSSMTFACAAQVGADGTDAANTTATTEGPVAAAKDQTAKARTFPTLSEKVIKSDVAKRVDADEKKLGDVDSSLPDNKFWLNFFPSANLSIVGTRFDLIDTCVTPGQAHGDVFASATLFRNPEMEIDLSVNFPAQRQNSGVCSSWYNQTIARGHFSSLSTDSMASSPDELNLAFRGNLHIFFSDGGERVHQVVLGQGHTGGISPKNNWWIGLEDASGGVPEASHVKYRRCWDSATPYAVCTDLHD